MICKFCTQEIPAGSVFCMFCGERVARKKKGKKDALKVPKPRQLKSGAWNIELRKEGESVTEATPEACLARARAIRAGFLKSEKALPKQSLSSVLRTFVDAHTNVLSPATIRGYESLMKSRFQSVMQEDVSDIDWQDVINREAKDVKPKTLANAWRLVTGAYRHAGIPVPQVRLPQPVKQERPWLDYEQIQTFLEAVKGKKCELACLLALHSLRMSEILALKKDSVQDGVIHVRGAVVIDKDGEYVFKDANKTARSRRDIPVMIDRLAEIWPDHDPVFQKHAAANSMLEDICEKAGLPKISMHSLRHGFASLAWHLHWDIMTTCRVGGWSTPAVVQGIYTHLAAKDANADIERMKSFYNGKNTNENTNASEECSDNAPDSAS